MTRRGAVVTALGAVGVVALLVLTAWGSHVPSPVPTREQAQVQAAALAAERGHPGSSAVCDEPGDRSWSCRLRDASGARGTAGGYVVDVSDDPDVSTRKVYWDIEFLVDASGGYSQERPVRDHAYEEQLGAEATRALRAVGIVAVPGFECAGPPVPRTLTGQLAASAGGPPVGLVIECAGGEPVTSARVVRTGPDTYRFSFTVPV